MGRRMSKPRLNHRWPALRAWPSAGVWKMLDGELLSQGTPGYTCSQEHRTQTDRAMLWRGPGKCHRAEPGMLRGAVKAGAGCLHPKLGRRAGRHRLVCGQMQFQREC